MKDETSSTATAEPAPAQVAPSIEAAFARYLHEGDHPEVVAFEGRLGGIGLHAQGHPRNVWEFIEDAVEGTGGFANGMYIYPFRLELESETPGAIGGVFTLSAKYLNRQRIAAYDGFPGDICADPWNLIVSKSDMVKRSVEGDARAEAWTLDVDGNGTTLMEFMEEPFRQAQKFGVAYVGEDRPFTELRTARDDNAPENEPFPYVIPTRNVRNWLYDARGDFLELMIQEPQCEEDRESHAMPVRVWTRDGWVMFQPIPGRDHKRRESWTVMDAAPLKLGRIPIVRLTNDRPEAGHSGLGRTPMLKIARIAQEVYNMDSEAREIERQAAAPIFTIPVKDAKGFAESAALVVGMESALAYDGEAGAPAWVQPGLEVLVRYDDRRQKKITASYRMANLEPLAGGATPSAGSGAAGGATKTQSGYHSEMVFSKTERRVSRLAGNTATAERELIIIYRQWRGLSREEAKAGVVVSYPREFGIRDLDKALNRLKLELETVQSDDATTAVLDEWFRLRFPLKKPEEIDKMVAAEVAKRATIKARMDALVAKGTKARAAGSGAFDETSPPAA